MGFIVYKSFVNLVSDSNEFAEKLASFWEVPRPGALGDVVGEGSWRGTFAQKVGTFAEDLL